MADAQPDDLARRYVAWLRQRAIAVIAGSALLLAAAVYLIAFQLPLRADFSYLLPQDAAAVQDLRRLESRVKSSETVLVILESSSPAETSAAAAAMQDGLTALRSPLVARVSGDEAETRAFLKARRHLFVPLADLQEARDALQRRIAHAKLAANPLFVDLGDDDEAATAALDKQRLDDLRARRHEAEAKLDRPTNLSPDGRVAKLEVGATFRATDNSLGAQLMAAMHAVRAQVVAAHPDVTIGFTGSVVTGLAEHSAISRGIMVSSLVTAALVALVLALYFRSARLLVLLVGTVGAATAISFGLAAITVGHLNAATAFLGAIIAGNGINYGILLIARFLEERRSHELATAGSGGPRSAAEGDTESIAESLRHAIAGTLRPTAVASLGAAIAYGSLAATSFKGFADFAVIGALGMLVCWVASYTLLPALILRFGGATRISQRDPFVSTMLVRFLGFRRSNVVVAASLLLLAGAGAIVVRYIANDPFEYDIKNLRSVGTDSIAARHWMAESDHNFGRGLSGRTYMAADRLEQVPMIVDALAKDRSIGTIESVLTFVPPDQDSRLALLMELRTMLDGALEDLPENERAELADLRPPDDLHTFTANDLPHGLRDRLTEKDGRIGYLIAIRPALDLDEWNGKDLIRFATVVRRLQLPDGETVTTSGSSVIFADIVAAIERDGTRVTAVALFGLIIMVVILVGRNRRAVAVIAATTAGSLLMIAVCALLDIKVNFLDFVALPISLGLGIDYAINVAHRHDAEAIPDPITTLRTSGSAVFVCSLTTMIGYGSLLVSDNLAIRGFGKASLIGEVTTVLAALVLVPALLSINSAPPPCQSRFPSEDQR